MGRDLKRQQGNIRAKPDEGPSARHEPMARDARAIGASFGASFSVADARCAHFQPLVDGR